MKVNKKRFRVTRLMRSGVRRGMPLAGKGDLARGAWLVWKPLQFVLIPKFGDTGLNYEQ